MIATVVMALLGSVALTASAQAVGDLGVRAGMVGPRMMLRMLDSAGATADQRAQIQQILLAARNDVIAQYTQLRALRRQEQTLFAQTTLDARAAETLRQQEQALREQASKRMLQARLDAAAVLTPTQRQTMAAKMAQRQALMERQRAERAALDASPSSAR
jgi:Spy/CpxP family protein refolding chaperone